MEFGASSSCRMSWSKDSIFTKHFLMLSQIRIPKLMISWPRATSKRRIRCTYFNYSRRSKIKEVKGLPISLPINHSLKTEDSLWVRVGMWNRRISMYKALKLIIHGEWNHWTLSHTLSLSFYSTSTHHKLFFILLYPEEPSLIVRILSFLNVITGNIWPEK